jgi:hypothetical protein
MPWRTGMMATMENDMNDTSDTPGAGEARTSATEQLAAAAQTKVLVTDARGRVIAVHKLTALNYYQLTRAMGESADSAALMDLAVTAASVRRIDTLDFGFPSREKDVEFLIQMLDFEGIKAAGEGLRQLHAKADDGTDTAKN